jgi:hypothetical protein
MRQFFPHFAPDYQLNPIDQEPVACDGQLII